MKQFLLLLTIAFIGMKGLAQAPSANLLAYYNFESNGNSHNSTYNFFNANTTTIPTYSSGKYGNAVTFALGSGLFNDTLSSAFPNKNQTEFTIAWWENRTSMSTSPPLYPTSIEFFASVYFRMFMNTFNISYGANIGSVVGTTNNWYEGGVGTQTSLSNAWHHYAIVCQYTNCSSGSCTTINYKLYKDGGLIGNTYTDSFTNCIYKNNGRVSVGCGTTGVGGQDPNKGYIGKVDELYIYTRALSDSEINLVKNNSTQTLSISDFNLKNLKASIYPNPASNNFTIEIENDIKSVEIYSLKGQKVKTTSNKTIDVSNLSKGDYFVRIEDVNNAVTTQKLIVE